MYSCCSSHAAIRALWWALGGVGIRQASWASCAVAAACKFESVAVAGCAVWTPSPQSFEHELLAGLAASPRSPSTAHLLSRVRLRTISRAIGVRVTSSNTIVCGQTCSEPVTEVSPSLCASVVYSAAGTCGHDGLDRDYERRAAGSSRTGRHGRGDDVLHRLGQGQ
jgi:hypothetical protein